MSTSFEIGPIRPPSEGGHASLLLRITRNCPWSRCHFCYGTLYGRQKFALRTLDEVKQDIDTVKRIADTVRQVSWGLGRGGRADRETLAAIIRSNPGLREDQCFVTVFNWLYSGGRTVFLQDADSLVMKTPQMVDILTYLKAAFPDVQRITTYARAKTLYRKSLDELKGLRAAGLTRLHVGLETGDEELLGLVDKGVTVAEHIAAGQKVKEAGFELSEYFMPDLGGRARWQQHARGTARLVNAIGPDYLRSRPFIPRKGTPLWDEYLDGRYQLSTAHERLAELKLMVSELNASTRLCFDHFANSWRDKDGGFLFRQDYEGYQFPEEKPLALDLIEQGLAAPESQHLQPVQMVGLDRM